MCRKIPWRMSATRKANLRKRLREVDSVIQAIEESGVQCNALRKAVELPKETEMSARDKYFVYSAKAKGYRKGIHKVPHFTKTTHRVNPKGF
ncbi:mitochondrial ribosomal protein L31-domain-containing protein [Phakopsora pachyrhizi]|uniref:Mitochondrial ribosomal protein L31-domain-containing protein n=1 Tax=Phakopsora pachyrhizi TaxID=170000 RepID=A0AAV0BRT6_PHAPC|nr:mitochondrial ribosomal protein L31-domain-containing protein [Phakopsora pachyrhizi]CAH7689460.1 mitochondrial ribosomal protein L31-domain-containing protein [Phakopsora pachyrhizi]